MNKALKIPPSIKGRKAELLAKLRAWQDFDGALIEVNDEAEVAELLALEKQHFKRKYVLLRLYGRFNALRTRRERAEIVAVYGK